VVGMAIYTGAMQ